MTGALRSLDESPTPSRRSKPSRLGVVCMTKRPAHLETWLEYHKRVVGVERFYLRVEDSSRALEELLTSPPWGELVEAEFVTGTVRGWGAQTQRQMTLVTKAIPNARRHGLTHLLHIDDDEVSGGCWLHHAGARFRAVELCVARRCQHVPCTTLTSPALHRSPAAALLAVRPRHPTA